MPPSLIDIIKYILFIYESQLTSPYGVDGVPDGNVDYEFHVSIVVIITATRNPPYVVCDLEILSIGFEILWSNHDHKLKDLIIYICIYL